MVDEIGHWVETLEVNFYLLEQQNTTELVLLSITPMHNTLYFYYDVIQIWPITTNLLGLIRIGTTVAFLS